MSRKWEGKFISRVFGVFPRTVAAANTQLRVVAMGSGSIRQFPTASVSFSNSLVLQITVHTADTVLLHS